MISQVADWTDAQRQAFGEVFAMQLAARQACICFACLRAYTAGDGPMLQDLIVAVEQYFGVPIMVVAHDRGRTLMRRPDGVTPLY